MQKSALKIPDLVYVLIQIVHYASKFCQSEVVCRGSEAQVQGKKLTL